MKKTFRRLIVGIVLAFFFLISIPAIATQEARQLAPTVPADGAVVLEATPLFVLKTGQGGLSVTERSERISQRLKTLADEPSLSLDQLEVYAADKDGIPLTLIGAGNIALMAISDRDAQLAGKTRPELAQEYSQTIKAIVGRYRQERQPQYLLRAALWVLLATLLFILALWIVNNTFARVYRQLQVWEQTYIHPVRLGNWELIRANQLDDIVKRLVWLAQGAIILGLLAVYLPFIFHQFPWTRGFAIVFRGYLIGTLQAGGQAFVGYLPNLLTIGLVLVITSLMLRLAKPFFRELSEERLSFPGFYPEWAQPTYRIATFLIIALAAVIAFPLLPGFQSPAFQGISVFLGLLISLGSTAVIANLISGSVLIYTRAFRVGDRIKSGDISGKVLETTLLVTRILTPTNEVVSIPNSQISTSSIVNFSFGYRELNQPFILRIPVYLGYEVPWREAYQALIQAALQTNGFAKSPEPFVLQGELNEVYVTYLLNVYIDVEYFKEKTLKEIEQARSQLHENIRDCCAKLGIRIFAPSYEADPTNYGPAAEKD